MSWWTQISGVIKVSPLGRTQAEKRYVLETVLNHLPRVTGSERDMDVRILESNGASSSMSRNEFFQRANNLDNGWMRCNEDYLLIVEGNLRDRMFDETYREFQKWLCRLAKRVYVEDVLVRIKGDDKSAVINESEKYWSMMETPFEKGEEPNWCEYLMWDRYKDWDIPLAHVVKYYECPEADAEWEKRGE